MTLALSLHSDYSIPTAETTAVGFSSPNKVRQTTAAKRLFYVCMLLRVSYGRAIAGAPSGAPVASFSGLLTLLSARPPHLAVGSGSTLKGGHAMVNTAVSARPEQTLSPFPLAARALVRLIGGVA